MKQSYVKKFVALTAIISVMTMGMTVNAEPKTMPDGTLFDAEYYAETNPDVVAVFGTDEMSLYEHYIHFGRTENREAVASLDKSVFDAEYYAQTNPDVVAVLGTDENALYQHYLQCGQKEGRKPTASSTAIAPEIPPVDTSTPVATEEPEMSIDEALQIWNNFWANECINFFDDSILAYFDEDGDYSIDQDEYWNLHYWVCYGNDTNYDDNTLSSPLSAEEIIKAVKALKQGYLNVPDTLFKVVYVEGVWLFL